MCLAAPGEILSIDGDDPLLRNARVSFGGVIKQASLAMTPEAGVGDYVLVHAGLAISLIDPEEAAAMLEAIACLDVPPDRPVEPPH